MRCFFFARLFIWRWLGKAAAQGCQDKARSSYVLPWAKRRRVYRLCIVLLMHHDNDATLSAVLPATMAAVGNVWKDPSLPLLCRVSTRVRNTKFCRRTSVRPSVQQPPCYIAISIRRYNKRHFASICAFLASYLCLCAAKVKNCWVVFFYLRRNPVPCSSPIIRSYLCCSVAKPTDERQSRGF